VGVCPHQKSALLTGGTQGRVEVLLNPPVVGSTDGQYMKIGALFITPVQFHAFYDQKG
jgi:hypothetical protein